MKLYKVVIIEISGACLTDVKDSWRGWGHYLVEYTVTSMEDAE